MGKVITAEGHGYIFTKDEAVARKNDFGFRSWSVWRKYPKVGEILDFTTAVEEVIAGGSGYKTYNLQGMKIKILGSCPGAPEYYGHVTFEVLYPTSEPMNRDKYFFKEYDDGTDHFINFYINNYLKHLKSEELEKARKKMTTFRDLLVEFIINGGNWSGSWYNLIPLVLKKEIVGIPIKKCEECQNRRWVYLETKDYYIHLTPFEEELEQFKGTNFKTISIVEFLWLIVYGPQKTFFSHSFLSKEAERFEDPYLEKINHTVESLIIDNYNEMYCCPQETRIDPILRRFIDIVNFGTFKHNGRKNVCKVHPYYIDENLNIINRDFREKGRAIESNLKIFGDKENKKNTEEIIEGFEDNQVKQRMKYYLDFVEWIDI